MEFRVLKQQDFERAVAFALDALGANEKWLRGYYTERIERGELFALWEGSELIAAAECRVSSVQSGVADLGMVVSPHYRKKGIATNILIKLLHVCREKGLSPICSTETDNVGPQKAIVSAGFIAYHRILEIKF